MDADRHVRAGAPRMVDADLDTVRPPRADRRPCMEAISADSRLLEPVEPPVAAPDPPKRRDGRRPDRVMETTVSRSRAPDEPLHTAIGLAMITRAVEDD